MREADSEDLAYIPGTNTLWAELPFVAANERVRHLGDLLLRRVRIGLLTIQGGKAHLKRIRTLCQPVLPWDRRRWKKEIAGYLEQWNRSHALPRQRAIPKRISAFNPVAVIGDWCRAIAAKILPKRWRSNPN